MRIDIHVDGFELPSQLRVGVQSRLLKALRPFTLRIQFVDVHLQARVGRDQAGSYSCEIVVNLRPSGELRVRTENAEMDLSVDRAADKGRAAVEHDVPQPPPEWPLARGEGAGGAIEIVLDDNRISQHQRELLERPENYLRPIRLRQCWRPPQVEDETSPEELEEALVQQGLEPEKSVPPEVSPGHRRRFMTSPTRATRTSASGGRWGRARAAKHGLRGRKTNHARHSSRTED